MKKINKRIVLASISGFGQDGPYAKRPGFDQIAQGMGGLMSITGLPGQGPVRVGIPIADLTAGLFCALGIMTALLEREVSGEGQWVTTSLLQAQIFMLDFQASRFLTEGEVPKQAGNNHPTSIPTGVFKTKDGYLNIAVTGGPIWDRFCNTVGHPEWLTSPDYKTGKLRSQNRDKLNAEIEKITQTKTSAEWVDDLQQGRRAVRADLQYRSGVRRSAGQASRHRQGIGALGWQQAWPRRPAFHAVAHAEQDRRAAAQSRRAYRRDLEGIRLQRRRYQGVARRQSSLRSME